MTPAAICLAALLNGCIATPRHVVTFPDPAIDTLDGDTWRGERDYDGPWSVEWTADVAASSCKTWTLVHHGQPVPLLGVVSQRLYIAATGCGEPLRPLVIVAEVVGR